MGIPIIGPFVDWVKDGVENVKDFVGDWKEDGFSAAVKEAADDIKNDKINNEASDNYEDKKWLVTAGSTLGGAVLGAKLGERFGVIGKVGLGVVCAVAAPKFINGIAEDVTGAIDYVNKCERNGQEVSFFKTLGSNIMDVKGQEYTGDSDIPDM